MAPKKGSKMPPRGAKAAAVPGVAPKTPISFDQAKAQAGVAHYEVVQMRLAIMSHGVALGNAANFDMKAWVPYVLRELGGITLADAQKFFPTGVFPAEEADGVLKKTEAPAAPAVPAEASTSI